MSLFAISDIHLSLAENKSMTVFVGWENYIERLSKNWRAVVSDDDITVISGDVSWGMKIEEALEDFRFIDALPGRKIIVKGNHDYWWSTVRKMSDFLDKNGIHSIEFLNNNCYTTGTFAVCGSRGWFIDAKSDEKILLREIQRLETSLKAAELTGFEPVVFLHYPPVYSDSRCEDILNVLKKHHIKRCFYGHIHGSGAANVINGEVDGIIFRHISCDCNDFCPVLVEKY